jgi:Domain of unknown function (DUF4166)
LTQSLYQAVLGERFELDAQPYCETWTRHFPSKTMTSRLLLEEGKLIERLGPARLTFVLSELDGTLKLPLTELHFFGIRCPNRLLPRAVANESANAERLHFTIQVSVPGVGLVAGYQGYLELPDHSP